MPNQPSPAEGIPPQKEQKKMSQSAIQDCYTGIYKYRNPISRIVGTSGVRLTIQVVGDLSRLESCRLTALPMGRGGLVPDPFRTAVPFRVQTTLFPNGLSPTRDISPKRVNVE